MFHGRRVHVDSERIGRNQYQNSTAAGLVKGLFSVGRYDSADGTRNFNIVLH